MINLMSTLVLCNYFAKVNMDLESHSTELAALELVELIITEMDVKKGTH